MVPVKRHFGLDVYFSFGRKGSSDDNSDKSDTVGLLNAKMYEDHHEI